MLGLVAGCRSPGTQDQSTAATPRPAAGAPDSATLRGTVSYRERIALPPGAVVDVTLADVSRADAPSVTIGAQRIDAPAGPPIHFALRYDRARITPRGTYAVLARISSGTGQLLWITTDRFAFPPADGSDSLHLLVRKTH